MSFGETLYYLMYELLSPFGMESSDADRNKWALFPFGDLAEADKNAIQAAFEGVLQEIVAYLDENGLTIADLMENGEWKTGNEDFIGLLSQLAGTMNATYNSADGMILFADSTSSNDVFPFVAVAETATDTKYLINGSTLSAIGDAIRAKEGTTETYGPTTMAQKITDDLVKPSGTLQIKNAQQVDVSSYQYAKVTDANLKAGNIKKDVTILGVTGTHEGASAPSLQSKSVTYTENGTTTIAPDEGYDGLSSVDVTVDVSSGGASPNLQTKAATPSTSSQSITPDDGYDGLSEVTISAMPSGSLNSPTISSSGLVTASVGTSGYLASGTNKTLQLSTQASKTVTPSTSNQTAVASGRYTTGAVTVKGDSNLVASNIKSGVSIFGVSGNLNSPIIYNPTSLSYSDHYIYISVPGITPTSNIQAMQFCFWWEDTYGGPYKGYTFYEGADSDSGWAMLEQEGSFAQAVTILNNKIRINTRPDTGSGTVTDAGFLTDSNGIVRQTIIFY